MVIFAFGEFWTIYDISVGVVGESYDVGRRSLWLNSRTLHMASNSKDKNNTKKKQQGFRNSLKPSLKVC